MEMLLKHSVYYLLARGLPGVFNLLAIALYTRMLSTDEYGRYALVIAGVGFFNMILFQWLRLSLLRFRPEYQENHQPLLSTILAAFVTISIFTGVAGLLLAIFWPDSSWQGLILLAVPLLWANAWFELNLELFRSKMQPIRYGQASWLKSVSALVVGVFLVLRGLGTYGPLIGLFFGFILVGLCFAPSEWRGIQPRVLRPVLSQVTRYGLPLTATFALGFVIQSSDRFLIAYYMGEGYTGSYVAGYDFAWNSIVLLMIIVNLSAYPLAISSLEKNGILAAQMQLVRNSRLQLIVSIPATVGLILLAPQIGNVIFGADFREDAIVLLPLISVAAFIHGIRSYHFDLAFQMGKHTVGQIWIYAPAALINLILNIIWIPRFGILGAAWSTLVAYCLALFLSVVIGKRFFQVRLSWQGMGEAVVAVSFMALALSLIPELHGVLGLLVSVAIGMAVYFTVIGLLYYLQVKGYFLTLEEKYGWK